MGLIFSHESVRNAQIPTEDDFVRAGALVVKELKSHPRLVKGGAIIGSLERGDVNKRSDLDLIVVGYDSRISHTKRLLFELGREVAETYHVMLDAHLWKSSAASGGWHFYGPSYMDTFAQMEGSDFSVGVIGSCFSFTRGGTVRDEMLKKMERKLRSMRGYQTFLLNHPETLWKAEDFKAFDASLDSWSTRVVRPLRTHITFARRLLWWQHGTLEDDGKAVVVERFLAEPAFEPFWCWFRLLCSINEEYDLLLEQASAREIPRHEYLREVRRLLKDSMSVSLGMLRRVIRYMRQPLVHAHSTVHTHTAMAA